MKKVDFFIVGQPKSGTTALSDFLGQHPDICMAFPKEPGFFARDHLAESDELYGEGTYLKARTMQEYERHFMHQENEQLIGEATTTYLYSTVAAREIYKYNPEAKIIIMLRHPVQFLHSLHMQYVNDGSEDERNFARALEKEESRKRGRELPKRAMAIVPSLLFYSERVKYSEQIERYRKYFPDGQILIVTAEDFRSDNLAVYRKVLDFLEIKNDFVPVIQNINSSSAPRSYAVHRMLNSRLVKRHLYEALGPQRYTRLKNVGIKLVLKQQQRHTFDQELEQRLLMQTFDEVVKASKITNVNLLSKWGYKDGQRRRDESLQFSRQEK